MPAACAQDAATRSGGPPMSATSGDRPKPAIRSLAFFGNLGAIIFPLGALALLAVPAIWIYQLLQWLELGSWPEIRVADALRSAGIAEPDFTQPLLQGAAHDLLAAPLSLVLLFGVGGAMFAYARFSAWLEKRCEPEKATTGVDD